MVIKIRIINWKAKVVASFLNMCLSNSVQELSSDMKNKGCVWLKKTEVNLNKKEKSTFAKDLQCFLQNFSLHTAYYPVDPSRSISEK